MHGGGPTAMPDDFTALSLEQRLALVEQYLVTLGGVVHSIREQIDGETDDGHIDP